MRVSLTLVAVVLSIAPSFAQVGPIPADRLTPKMLHEISEQYPVAAVQCLEDALAAVREAEHEYIFTSDFQLGQLWLMSFASWEDPSIPLYVCTPEGLASDPESAMEAMLAGRMGLPF